MTYNFADRVYTSDTMEADTEAVCLRNLSCLLLEEETAKRDVIATVRLVLSLLSILGALSIIISVIYKKQVFSHKVHPIFVLSIADCMLASLWVVGGAVWLRDHPNNLAGCFAITILTVILECVTVNLTLVYALLAYAGIKDRDFTAVYIVLEQSSTKHVWHPFKTIVAYLLAWFIPVFLILIPFGILAARQPLIQDANSCACWCLPYYGNVIPIALPGDPISARYYYNLRKFVAVYGSVVGTNYLVVFILLVVIYYKVLKRIKNMREMHEQNRSTHNLYGAAEALVIKGQSQAKTRVVAFLTVFIISGFFTVVLSYSLTIAETIFLSKGKVVKDFRTQPYHLHTFVFALYILQSLTITLQGFLNAIVYGWTRENFLHIMAKTSRGDSNLESDPDLYESLDCDDEKLSESGLLTSMETEPSYSIRRSFYVHPLSDTELLETEVETETENEAD